MAIAGVLLGSTLGFLTILLLQGLSPINPPEGVSLQTGSAYNNWVSSLTTDAYLTILAIFLAGGLVAGIVAGLLVKGTPYKIASIMSGFILLILTIGKFLAFNHPEWLTYAACIGFMVISWLGGWITRRF